MTGGSTGGTRKRTRCGTPRGHRRPDVWPAGPGRVGQQLAARATSAALRVQVYKPGFSGYPQLHGKLVRRAVESLKLESEESHLLLVIDRHLRDRRVELREMFSQLDPAGRGDIQVWVS